MRWDRRGIAVIDCDRDTEFLMRIEERRQAGIQALVDHWFQTDDQLQAVYHFEIPDSTDAHVTVLLLQVTEATPTSPDQVVTYGFAPSRDFQFPLALAQVTPAEWDDIKSGKLALPEGWRIDRVQEVKRAA